MNRFSLPLLALLLLSSQASAQPTPKAAVPPPTTPAPATPAPTPPTVPESDTLPAPTPLAIPATPTDITEVTDDSCGCSGGCCNLAKPWRLNLLRKDNSDCDSCSLDLSTTCGPPGRFWIEFDALYWHVGGDSLPPLVTTNPSIPLPPTNVAGTLPGANVLVGNEFFNNDSRAGGRLNIGGWLNDSRTLGIQAGGFLLLDQSKSVTFVSGGDPILARPFINAAVTPNSQQSVLVAYPGEIAGAINVRENNTLQGYDFAVRGNVCCGSTWRIDTILGYRYLRFTEQLQISENAVAGPGNATNLPPGTTVSVVDRFDTGNVFHGAQVGFTGEVRVWEKLSMMGTAKVSFGVVDQGVGVEGYTRFSTDPAGSPPRVGGLLALNSNIGAYHRSDTSLVPELTLTLGYQVWNNVKLRFGYDMIYLPNVQRPGQVIDLGLDPTRIPPILNPTINRPAFDHLATDVFIQGLHGGIEIRF